LSFLLPLGLLSLLALPIVLLLHLVRQRRQRLQVPSLELWRLAPTPVQRKPRRLPLTLLLLLHLLVAALLAVSLGRPLIAGGTFAPSSTVVVVDTSTSMATRDAGASGDLTRLEAAQAEARQIFGAARKGDRIGLVAMGSTARLLGRGGPEAAQSLIAAAGELRAAGGDGELAGALNLAMAANQPENGQVLPGKVVVLTDRAYGSRATATPISMAGELDWRPLGDAADNVAIVAFASRRLRNGAEQLYARVANLGANPAARTLQLFLDGKAVQREPMRLEVGREAEWSWPLPRGAKIAEARLSSGDAAPIDDSASLALTGGLTRRVLLVSAAPTALERSLRAQPDVALTLASPPDYRTDPGVDLVVFSGFVPKTLPAAPTLIVAPPRDNALIKVTGAQRDLRPDTAPDRRFAAIDLRAIHVDRAQSVERPAWAATALAAGDTPLVLTGIVAEHPRTIWTFDPADTNLSGRLAFPLLTAATLDTLLPRAANALRLGQAAPEAMVTPAGTTIKEGTTLTEPGIYRWAGKDGQVAVNALDAAESTLVARERPAVTSAARTIGRGAYESTLQYWRSRSASTPPAPDGGSTEE
jgi:hypothetical protein